MRRYHIFIYAIEPSSLKKPRQFVGAFSLNSLCTAIMIIIHYKSYHQLHDILHRIQVQFHQASWQIHKVYSGRYQEAKDAARKAGTWAIVSASIGILFSIIYIVFVLLAAAKGVSSGLTDMMDLY